MENKDLLIMAKKAMENAYAPYSNFRVGAALLTGGGKVFTGCNVENSSYGASICAERAAAVKAVSEGQTGFIKLAIVSSGGRATYPCGICRQFLSEFSKDCIVIMEDEENAIFEITLKELFPYAFSLNDYGTKK